METKVCSKCQRELTVDNFGKIKSGKNGLKTKCKECYNQYNGQYQKDNKEAIAEYKKQRYQGNKEYFKQYFQDNKETIAKKKKQYRQDNREYFMEYRKQYAQDNKEYFKQYRQEHMEEGRAHSQTRRARKRLLPFTLTIQQWESIKEHFNNECAYCGKELPLTQEHLIPVTKGGEYTHNNIICACQSCNSSKGTKLLNDWYPQHKYYSKKREQKILTYLGYENKIQQLALV